MTPFECVQPTKISGLISGRSSVRENTLGSIPAINNISQHIYGNFKAPVSSPDYFGRN